MKLKVRHIMIAIVAVSLGLILIISINAIRSHTIASNAITFSETDNVDLSLDEVVSYATHIINAEYVGDYTSKYGTELMFEPVELLKGNIDTDTENGELNAIAASVIYVQPLSINNEQESIPYQKNTMYMLFLEKNSSVYYEHDKYVQLSEEQISSSDNRWEQYNAQVQKDLAELGKQALSAYGISYTNSTEIKDILEASPNIFVVKIEDIHSKSTVTPTTVYRGSVTKTIRNTSVNDGNILITLFNDTVDIGNEYMLLLADITETAPVYTLSSKNSVYGMEAAKAIPELEKLLYDARSFLYEASTNEELSAPFTVEALEAAFVEYVNYYSYYYPEDTSINLYQDRINESVNIELRDYSQSVYQKKSNKFEIPVIYGVDEKTGDYISFYYNTESKQVYVNTITEAQNTPFLDSTAPYYLLGNIQVRIPEVTFPFTEEISAYKTKKIIALQEEVKRTFDILKMDDPDARFTIKIMNFLDNQHETWMLIEGSNHMNMYALLVIDEYFYSTDDKAKDANSLVNMDVTRGELIELTLDETWFNLQLESDAYYFKKMFLEDPPLLTMEIDSF